MANPVHIIWIVRCAGRAPLQRVANLFSSLGSAAQRLARAKWENAGKNISSSSSPSSSSKSPSYTQTMDQFKPPPSSQPPSQGKFGLRLTIPASVPHHISPLSPIVFLLRAALIFPQKVAIVHPERGIRFTYAEWAARCLSLTFAIKSISNWKKGDRVAIIAPNTPMILESYYGILAAGGIATPLK